MNDFSRVYPYDKSIMLSILYDTLDALGWHIDKANSERGTILALSEQDPACPIRIACNAVSSNSGETVVQIYSELEEEAGKRLAGVILDEISATEKRSRQFVKNILM